MIERITLLWNKLVEKFLPHYFEGSSAHDKREIRVLINFLLFAEVSYIFQFSFLALMGLKYASLNCLVGAILNLLILIFQKKYLSYESSSRLILVTAYLIILSACLIAGLGVNPSIIWFFLLPYPATMLLGARRGFYWTAFVAIFTYIIFFLGAKFGYSFNEYNADQFKQIGLDNFLVGPFIFFAFAVHAYISKEKAILSLEESSAERQKLLSILFHDLGNAIVIAQAKTNKKSLERKDTSKAFEQVEKANKAINMMQELINHVKELEQIKAGKLEISLSRVSLEEVFSDVAFIFKERLDQKEQTLDVSIEEGATYVKAERVSLLNNVMNNFVSNAIKFSSKNSSIFIYSTLENGKVCISIKDRGQGMSESLVNELFSFNKKTTHKGTEGECGSGFGMPIAKSVIESFGGRLSIESRVGEGTEFKVYLDPWS